MKAPDGSRWLVRRRWFDRSLPDLGERFQVRRDQVVEASSQVNLFGGEFSDVEGAIAAIVIGALVIFVLLPLLGDALEVIALVFVLFSGMIGRIVLGRPWIVEAVPQSSDGEPIRIPVKGWRRAGQAVAELERGIATSGPPDPSEVRATPY